MCMYVYPAKVWALWKQRLLFLIRLDFPVSSIVIGTWSLYLLVKSKRRVSNTDWVVDTAGMYILQFWRPEVQDQGVSRLILTQASFLGLWMPAFSCSQTVFLCVWASQCLCLITSFFFSIITSFYKDTGQVGLRPTLMTSF